MATTVHNDPIPLSKFNQWQEMWIQISVKVHPV